MAAVSMRERFELFGRGGAALVAPNGGTEAAPSAAGAACSAVFGAGFAAPDFGAALGCFSATMVARARLRCRMGGAGTFVVRQLQWTTISGHCACKETGCSDRHRTTTHDKRIRNIHNTLTTTC